MMSETKEPYVVKRKVTTGDIDVHPNECAIIVNYTVQAWIMNDNEYPILGEKKQMQKIIKIKSLTANSDISELAKELVDKCKLIHPSRIHDVEQQLFYLQKRKMSMSGGDPDKHTLKKQMIQLQENKFEEEAYIEKLDDYISLLYEDMEDKIRSTRLLLQLVKVPENMEVLLSDELFVSALARVLREDGKKSLELVTNIIYIFFCFSNYSIYHPIITAQKIGDMCLRIADQEINREKIWREDLENLKKKYQQNTENTQLAKSLEHENKKFQSLLQKQDQLLFVLFHLLLNLAEDLTIEVKMLKRDVIKYLVFLLDRKLPQLLVVIITFLKKLSVFKDNKKEFLELSNEFLPKILKLLQPENSSLFNIILRLLINLSHDQEIRILMVKYGFIPKICELIQVKQNYTYIIQLLYQLSIDDRNKIAFSYTDIIPTIMKMILETKGDRVDVDLIALGINLACNVKCAEYMCEDQGIKFLMKRALKTHDPLLLKMIRNISMHEGPTKMLFLDYIDDIMLLLEKSLKEPDLLVELLGILSNFTIEEFDWAKLTDTYHLLELIASQLQEVCVNSKTLANAQEEAAKENSKELKSSSTSEYSLYEEKSNTMTENQLSEDDDVTLQFVVLLGTMSNDEGIAPKVIEMDIIPLLITLMICKEEDDEIILQIIYAIYQFLLHESTRTILLNQTHIVSYLIDLLYDRNVKIREMCDTCLDIIAETNEEWVIKIRQQRFQWHNSEWLRLMANTLGREEDTGDGMMNEDILEYNTRGWKGREYDDEYENSMFDSSDEDNYNDEEVRMRRIYGELNVPDDDYSI